MCTNMPFKIYTENKYMWTLSLAIVSISISITIGDGTETRSMGRRNSLADQNSTTRVVIIVSGS